MDLNLENKNAIVCGSTQGIGKAIAIELALLGANIVLIARDEARLKQTLEELDTSKNQKHAFIIADFTEPHSLRSILERNLEKGKVYHILINNTGGPKGGELIKAPVDNFEAAFDMHIKCNHILMQSVVEGMKKEHYGRVINILSTSVKQPIDNLGISNMTRAAVANWAKTLSNELAQFGITINNILPGFTQTERLNNLIQNKSERTALTNEQVIEQMQNSIPARRFGTAEEIANAAAFLATPAASYINGTNITVDGGRTGSW